MTRNEQEWAVILDQIKRRKEQFIARLERNVRKDGDCYLWVGRGHSNGYGEINFRIGTNKTFCIGAHRLFLILKIQRPIADGMEAGHFHCHNARCMKHVVEQTRTNNLYQRDLKRGWKKEQSPF